MSDLDDLNKRLNKLKEFNKTIKEEQVTDEQLYEKLRKLKGLKNDNKDNLSSNYYVPPKFKCETEETDYLFKQLMNETEIDNKFNNNQSNDDQLFSNLINKQDNSKYDNKFNDNFTLKSTNNNKSKDTKLLDENEFNKELNYLKNRMKELNYNYKDKSTNQNNQNNKIIFKTDSSEEDEEEQFTQIVKKFVDEGELPIVQNDDTKFNDEDDFKLDKFDFCYICNEDAVIECRDCDDRFCAQCFVEFHKDPEYKDHKFKKIKLK